MKNRAAIITSKIQIVMLPFEEYVGDFVSVVVPLSGVLNGLSALPLIEAYSTCEPSILRPNIIILC